jgi:hypothetical protein
MAAAAVSLVASSSAGAGIISLQISGYIDSITDPDNLLLTDLGLTIGPGDAFTAGYTIDDTVEAGPPVGGFIYTLSSDAFSQFVHFTNVNSDYVWNTNTTYRITILDNYTHECLGTGDAWAISTKIGGSYLDSDGSSYLLILDIVLIDRDQDKHAGSALYFNDTLAGWEDRVIQIGKWYGDFDPRNTILLSSYSCAEPPVTVSVDIKPGSDPNGINLCNNGTVPVAVLGSGTLDVSNVNTETLRFAEAAVKVVGRKDPSTLCSPEDVNGDGIDDLVCQYLTTDIAGIDGQSSTATVNGELLDGTPIQGTDGVLIVKDTCN